MLLCFVSYDHKVWLQFIKPWVDDGSKRERIEGGERRGKEEEKRDKNKEGREWKGREK